VIVGSVCARGGSKGVPKKNLRPLLGRPLIAYSVECALKATRIDRVVVSTDDAEIADVVRQLGAEVPFVRPPHLASDGASKWDVFRHLVETLEAQDDCAVDVLVDLDSGVPLRLPEDVDNTVDLLLSGDADVAITAYEAERNPYFNMVEHRNGGVVTIVKQPRDPITCRQHAPTVYSLSPAAYAIRRHALDRFSHWSLAKMQIHEIPRDRGIDIDTEFDFRMVEYLMRNQETGK
jgi:CMP-N,N'-diacetyllegionaminic acid synthase